MVLLQSRWIVEEEKAVHEKMKSSRIEEERREQSPYLELLEHECWIQIEKLCGDDSKLGKDRESNCRWKPDAGELWHLFVPSREIWHFSGFWFSTGWWQWKISQQTRQKIRLIKLVTVLEMFCVPRRLIDHGLRFFFNNFFQIDCSCRVFIYLQIYLVQEGKLIGHRLVLLGTFHLTSRT